MMSTPPPTASQEWFAAGDWELQGGTGAYGSFSPDGSDRDTINYTLGTYRLGYMLNDVAGNGWWRGNSQILLEGFYGSVFEGPGDWLAGGNVILRYNFVQPEARFIPYLQLGAGGMGNDIYKDQEQQAIGQSFEFSLLAGVGIRYHFNQKWGVVLEGGYRHFSNANQAERDRGLDSAGATLGLIYRFQ